MGRSKRRIPHGRNFERDYTRLGTLPHQAEWEAHMAKFQKARPEDAPHEKWKLMKRIFKL